MKKLKLGIGLIGIIMMVGVLAQAASAASLVEYALLVVYNKVDTNIGPAWFAAQSDPEGNVTGILKSTETSDEYRLNLDNFDAYILDATTKERVGVRLSGQVSTADQGPSDATMMVTVVNTQTVGVDIGYTIVFTNFPSFEAEGALTIETPQSATDQQAKARMEPLMVDLDGDGEATESFWALWRVFANGSAGGRIVWNVDGARTKFDVQQGDVFCNHGQPVLELNGSLEIRLPDGRSETRDGVTVIVVPDMITAWGSVLRSATTLEVDGKVMQVDTRGGLDLYVSPCQ